jgi:hypothetical protein
MRRNVKPFAADMATHGQAPNQLHDSIFESTLARMAKEGIWAETACRFIGCYFHEPLFYKMVPVDYINPGLIADTAPKRPVLSTSRSVSAVQTCLHALW